MLRRIGAEEGGEFKAVASGTLPSGRPVIVNADGTVSVVENVSSSAGSSVVFALQTTGEDIDYFAATFDSNSNKVVIAWADGIGNTNYGKAIVGTVSGSTISFGSAVTFAAASTEWISATFDSNTNKVVIVYRDSANSDYGTAIVGTVSGTSISFGTEVVWNSGTSDYISCAFDSTNNRVVVAFRDIGAGSPFPGKVVIGTVSGTSISFGSEVTFNSGNTQYTTVSFDSSSEKVVVAYKDGGNSNYGTAIVGTVSGTSISFGSEVVFNSGNSTRIKAVFDSNNNKSVIVFADSSDSTKGKAIVGTVSGTSISFGSEVAFPGTTYANSLSAAFDSVNNKVVINYSDVENSNNGFCIIGTVSGTSISFGTAFTFESTDDVGSDHIATVFDPIAQKSVVVYEDFTGGSPEVRSGSAVVLTTGGTTLTSENYIGISRSGAADTKGVIIDTQGAIADNLSGLTAGQSYFVQGDGTLGTTAASPSVFAGTAVSATELIVKG